jgi:hypothetical protein
MSMGCGRKKKCPKGEMTTERIANLERDRSSNSK